MRATVLDDFDEGMSKGILCRVDFTDYISSLPKNFRQYFVQRGIATNRYLDNLWETIVEKKHIPLMVIVAHGKAPSGTGTRSIELGNDWKILDGLQRTHRMKLISEIVAYINEQVEIQPTLLSETTPIVKVVREYRELLVGKDWPPSLFAKILTTRRSMPAEKFADIFKGVNLWLEVWFGLNENEQIQKMLILNAGHKSVNIKHQIELLFSDYLPILQESFPDGEIIRERNTSSIIYSKSRKPGQFHFSHLVTAFQSLDAGKPISTNADYAAEKSLSMTTEAEDKLEFNIELLRSFAEFVWELDNSMRADGNSITWLGREVVLAGLFGAIGKYSLEHSRPKIDVLNEFRGKLFEFSGWLDLDNFEQARNRLNLAKVNIGNKNKIAVQNATLQFLERPNGPKPNWASLFGAEQAHDV